MKSEIFGLCLTVTVNAAAVLLCMNLKMTEESPRQRDTFIEMEFVKEDIPEEEEIQPAEQQEEIAQEAQDQPGRASAAPAVKESAIGEHGDVEVDAEEEKLDEESLFKAPKGPDKSDSLASSKAAGKAHGTTGSSGSDFNLGNRSVRGKLPKPAYSHNESGIVVVDISVTPEGNVVKAKAGGKGTSITNRKMWKDAEEAALKAKFNEDSSAGEIQTGTITYIFTLD